jgi:hypothetical protein
MTVIVWRFMLVIIHCIRLSLVCKIKVGAFAHHGFWIHIIMASTSSLLGGPVGPFLIGPTHSETLRMPVDIRILRQWSDKYKLPHPLALARAHLSFHP